MDQYTVTISIAFLFTLGMFTWRHSVYILWSMDPDKGFLDVSEEKNNNEKIYDFLFVEEKKGANFLCRRKK